MKVLKKIRIPRHNEDYLIKQISITFKNNYELVHLVKAF